MVPWAEMGMSVVVEHRRRRLVEHGRRRLD
jgi:hypothetical protein